MRAAGAALIGAAVVAAAVAVASRSDAADSDVDFDIDAELQLANNYYVNAITNPAMWSAGQLISLEGLLMEYGMQAEAANIHDLRTGVYGDAIPTPEPLPEIRFIPQAEIDAIADSLEQEIAE